MTSTSLLESLESRQFFAASPVVDASYGSGGATTVRFKPVADDTAVSTISLEAASNGSAYVLGRTGKTTQIRKLTADGAVDTSWFAKKNNLLLFPAQAGHTAAESKSAVDAADRLLVLNGTSLSRFTPAGAVDTTFGTNGTLEITDFAGNIDFDVDATNKIYVTGLNASGSTIRVERFISKGKFDKTFDEDGRLTVGLASYQSAKTNTFGQQVRVLSSGDVMVGGATRIKRVVTGMEAVRLNADGTLDSDYGPTNSPGITVRQGSSLVGLVADGTVSIRSVTGPDDAEPNTAYPAMITVNGSSQDTDYYYDASELEPSGDLLLLDRGLLRRTASINPNGQSVSTPGVFFSGISAFTQTDIDTDSASLLVSAISKKGAGRVTVVKLLSTSEPSNA